LRDRSENEYNESTLRQAQGDTDFMIYYLSLGSNVGDKLEYLKKALLGLNKIGQIIKKSAVYHSESVGEKSLEMFFNATIKFETVIEPLQLLDKIKHIEDTVGRTKTYRWGPREIDIDIIEYDGPVIKSDKLNIPHIEMENRKFVLLPLNEIEKEFKTRNGQTINQILLQCSDTGMVEPINYNW